MTKPEFSFKVSYASTIVNSATISDITKLNKVLKHIKSKKSYIKFLSLNIDSLSIRIYWCKFQQPSQWRKSRWTNNIYYRQRKPELSISVELIKNKMCSPINLSCWNFIYDRWMLYPSQHKLLTISSSNIISITQ